MRFTSYNEHGIEPNFKDTVEESKKYEIKAYCTSKKCLALDYLCDVRTFSGATKFVSKSKVECPDCGHALFWKKTEITEELYEKT